MQVFYILASQAYYRKLPKRVWSFSRLAAAWSSTTAVWYVA